MRAARLRIAQKGLRETSGNSRARANRRHPDVARVSGLAVRFRRRWVFLVRPHNQSIILKGTYTATQTGGATGFSASGSGNIKDTVSMPAAAKIIYKAN